MRNFKAVWTYSGLVRKYEFSSTSLNEALSWPWNQKHISMGLRYWFPADAKLNGL